MSEDFAESLEKSGEAALKFAQSYMEKLNKIVGRELGAEKVSTGDELLGYAQFRHDPVLLKQAFLDPLRRRYGKGKGNELWRPWVQEMEAKLLAPKEPPQ